MMFKAKLAEQCGEAVLRTTQTEIQLAAVEKYGAYADIAGNGGS